MNLLSDVCSESASSSMQDDRYANESEMQRNEADSLQAVNNKPNTVNSLAEAVRNSFLNFFDINNSIQGNIICLILGCLNSDPGYFFYGHFGLGLK